MPTSKKVAKQAGRDLRNPETPKKDRAPIAAALAETKRKPAKKGTNVTKKPAKKGKTQ
jgi:hypothetical protein